MARVSKYLTVAYLKSTAQIRIINYEENETNFFDIDLGDEVLDMELDITALAIKLLSSKNQPSLFQIIYTTTTGDLRTFNCEESKRVCATGVLKRIHEGIISLGRYI